MSFTTTTRRAGATLALAVTMLSAVPLTAASAAILDTAGETLIAQAEVPYVQNSAPSGAGSSTFYQRIFVHGDEDTERYASNSSYTGDISKVSISQEGRAALAANGVSHNDALAVERSNVVVGDLPEGHPDRILGQEHNPGAGKALNFAYELTDATKADLSALLETGSKRENIVLHLRDSYNDERTSFGVPNLTRADFAHRPVAEPGVLREDNPLTPGTTQETAFDSSNKPKVSNKPTSSFWEGKAGDPSNSEVNHDGRDTTVVKTWFTDDYKGPAAVSPERLNDISMNGQVRGHNKATLVENSSEGENLGGYAVLTATDVERGVSVDLTESFRFIVASDYGVDGLDEILKHNSEETAKVVNEAGDRLHMLPRATVDQATYNETPFYNKTNAFYRGYTDELQAKKYADVGVLAWPTAAWSENPYTPEEVEAARADEAERRAVWDAEFDAEVERQQSAWEAEMEKEIAAWEAEHEKAQNAWEADAQKAMDTFEIEEKERQEAYFAENGNYDNYEPGDFQFPDFQFPDFEPSESFQFDNSGIAPFESTPGSSFVKEPVVTFNGGYDFDGNFTDVQIEDNSIVRITKEGATSWLHAPDANMSDWQELNVHAQPTAFLDGQRFAFEILSIEGDTVTMKSLNPNARLVAVPEGIAANAGFILRGHESYNAQGYEAVLSAAALPEPEEPPVTPEPPLEETPPPVEETPTPEEPTTPPLEETPPPAEVENPPVEETPPPVEETPEEPVPSPEEPVTPPVEEEIPPAEETPEEPVTDTSIEEVPGVLVETTEEWEMTGETEKVTTETVEAEVERLAETGAHGPLVAGILGFLGLLGFAARRKISS